jgi:hypothetical protein
MTIYYLGRTQSKSEKIRRKNQVNGFPVIGIQLTKEQPSDRVRYLGQEMRYPRLACGIYGNESNGLGTC